MSKQRPPQKSPGTPGLRERNRATHDQAMQSYVDAAAAQRTHAEKLAQQVERGEPLSSAEGKLVAAIIREAAKRIPQGPPRGPGRPREFNHGLLAWDYYRLRHVDLLSDSHAKELLATEYEIDDRHVSRILDRELPDIMAFFGPPTGQTPED